MSQTTLVTRPAVSKAWASLIRMPFSAPRPEPTSTAAGVANPSAQGQATTSTAMAHDNPVCQPPGPVSDQATKVTAAITKIAGTKRATTQSASRCTSALDSWALVTSVTVCASHVSPAARVTRARNEPPTLNVPSETVPA